jgi:hypothetical protein
LRKVSSAAAAFILAVGPWLALLASLGGPHAQAVLASGDSFGWTGATQLAAPVPTPSDPSGGGLWTEGCTCREIDVNADNSVTDSSVRSGDARVTNFSLTYVTAGYAQSGDAKVNVDQNADAQSGDAIAGQILGVNGGGCAHITVHAHNLVANTDVQSGDAIAKNKSFVFLDPSVKRDDVKVNVDQQANAQSGTALAGQIIGVNGGGGPCGGVSVDATNDVRNVDVQSGNAVMDNWSLIQQCSTDGCVREILLLLHWAGDTVQVCSADGCEDMSIHDFAKALKEQADGTPIDEQLAADATPTPDPNDDGHVDGKDIAATPAPRHKRPRTSPTPAPDEPTPSPGPTETPSPMPEDGSTLAAGS